MDDARGPDGGSVPPGADRVERTGLALVHEGEYIVPAPGSQAVLAPVGEGGTVVNYWFPVEVELVGELRPSAVEQVAGHVFAELERELKSRR